MEAVVDSLVDMGFFKAEVFADVFGIITRPCDFGGQDDFISVACFFEPCSNDALGFPLGLGIRRDWIEFGYIKKINPLFHCVIHLLMAFGFCILSAPSHGTQANLTDFDISIRQKIVIHNLVYRIDDLFYFV